MRRLAVIGLLLTFGALPCLAADEDKWSTVKGRVVFDDAKHKIPVRVFPPAAAGASLAPCAVKDPGFLTEDWIVNPKNKGVKDAFVWLAPEPTDDEWKRLKATGKEQLRDFPSLRPEQLHPDLKEPKEKTVEMDQPCCRFIPHALGVRIGQTVVVKNSADFVHNANWKSRNNGERNVVIPTGKQEDFPITKPERYEVKVTCDVHKWMSASIRVFDHPYFALTNADGDYEIKQAPVGKYRIFVWHPGAGFSGKTEGRFGYELEIKAKTTEVKPYSVTLDDK